MPANWWDTNTQIWQGAPGAELQPEAAPQQAPAPTWSKGVNPNSGMILGYDLGKLNDTSYSSPKYNAAVRAFSAGLKQDVGVARGGLDNMTAYLQANGFQGAKVVGDDKIDFGDGAGPIDVIRHDGQIVFQDPRGVEGGHAPASRMPTLGSIGQPSQPMPQPMGDLGGQPAMNPYLSPPPVQTGPALQDAAQQQEQWLRAQAQQASQRPMTVQGPQAQALRIPGFANGVQDFRGGPAIVGEKGPELLNLPAGSDVIPFGNGGQTPDVSGPLTLGGGGQMPGLGGTAGAVNFGGGGANLPQIGTPQTGAPTRVAGPMSGGPGQAAWTGPGPAPWETPSAAQGPQNSGGYTYNPMAAPQNYNPAALQGPDRLTLGSIGQPGAVNAGQVGPGQQVTPGMAQAGERVSYDPVTGQAIAAPDRVSTDRVQGPASLGYDRLQNPGAFQNLNLSQFQADPSYQFDKAEQIGALENSATAKGMLFHPNTARALQETASNLANRQYDTVNARNLALQQQNFGNQATVAGQNNAAGAQAYGLTNQFQQQAQLANQSTGLQAALANQSTGLQAGMFNAQQAQQAALANQQAGLSAGQFNSGQQQQVNLANIGNQLQAGQFNSAQGQQAALANQSANLNAGQFNAQMGFNTQAQNLQNQLAAYNAYQPLQQQNQQFNAAQGAAAAQNNFANQFSVNQANNAGSLGAFQANLGAELGRGNLANQAGQLALGNRSADQSFQLGNRQIDQSAAASAGQLALGNRSADQSYDLGLRNNALGNRQADQSYGISLGNLGLGQGQLDLSRQGQAYNQDANTFNTNYGVYRDNRDASFDQDYRLAQIGAAAAGNYGNQAGALYSGQGNANAGAAIGRGNAWSGALGNIGNVAGQAGAALSNPSYAPYVDPRYAGNQPQPWRPG